MKFDKLFADKYIKDLCKQHKIKVVAYSATSCGWARIKQREIKIPKPTNLDKFGVCLHEIKHILDGNKGKRFEREFACDLYALNIMQQLGHDTDKWERRMRWHSLSRIAMATNRGLSIHKIGPEIKTFFKEVDFALWISKKVFIRYSKTETIGYIIEYAVAISKFEIEELLNRQGLMLEKSQCDDSSYNRWLVISNESPYGSDFGSLTEIVKYYNLVI